MLIRDIIPDAPVYKANIQEMDDLSELLANASEHAIKFGAVRIDPPEGWIHPPLRMSPQSRFFVRMQTLPEAPFVHPSMMAEQTTSRTNRPSKNVRKSKNMKRSSHKQNTQIVVVDDEDDKDDDALLVLPNSKNTKQTIPEIDLVSPPQSHRKSPKPTPDLGQQLQAEQIQKDNKASDKNDFPSNAPQSNVVVTNKAQCQASSKNTIDLEKPEGKTIINNSAPPDITNTPTKNTPVQPSKHSQLSTFEVPRHSDTQPQILPSNVNKIQDTSNINKGSNPSSIPPDQLGTNSKAFVALQNQQNTTDMKSITTPPKDLPQVTPSSSFPNPSGTIKPSGTTESGLTRKPLQFQPTTLSERSAKKSSSKRPPTRPVYSGFRLRSVPHPQHTSALGAPPRIDTKIFASSSSQPGKIAQSERPASIPTIPLPTETIEQSVKNAHQVASTQNTASNQHATNDSRNVHRNSEFVSDKYPSKIQVATGLGSTKAVSAIQSEKSEGVDIKKGKVDCITDKVSFAITEKKAEATAKVFTTTIQPVLPASHNAGKAPPRNDPMITERESRITLMNPRSGEETASVKASFSDKQNVIVPVGPNVMANTDQGATEVEKEQTTSVVEKEASTNEESLDRRNILEERAKERGESINKEATDDSTLKCSENSTQGNHNPVAEDIDKNQTSKGENSVAPSQDFTCPISHNAAEETILITSAEVNRDRKESKPFARIAIPRNADSYQRNQRVGYDNLSNVKSPIAITLHPKEQILERGSSVVTLPVANEKNLSMVDISTNLPKEIVENDQRRELPPQLITPNTQSKDVDTGTEPMQKIRFVESYEHKMAATSQGRNLADTQVQNRDESCSIKHDLQSEVCNIPSLGDRLSLAQQENSVIEQRSIEPENVERIQFSEAKSSCPAKSHGEAMEISPDSSKQEVLQNMSTKIRTPSLPISVSQVQSTENVRVASRSINVDKKEMGTTQMNSPICREQNQPRNPASSETPTTKGVELLAQATSKDNTKTDNLTSNSPNETRQENLQCAGANIPQSTAQIRFIDASVKDVHNVEGRTDEGLSVPVPHEDKGIKSTEAVIAFSSQEALKNIKSPTTIEQPGKNDILVVKESSNPLNIDDRQVTVIDLDENQDLIRRQENQPKSSQIADTQLRESGQEPEISCVSIPVRDEVMVVPKVKKRRRANQSSQLYENQSEDGRLKNPIVFPDSPHPISLKEYERNAILFHKQTLSHIEMERKGISEKYKNLLSEKEAWTQEIDVLETEFWNAMTKGVNGKPITVAYGVDVEAEGAFDSNEMSYVEWYGKNGAGEIENDRQSKSTKRGRNPNSSGDRKAKRQKLEKTTAEGNKENLGIKIAKEKRTLQDVKIIEPKSHVGNLNEKGLLRHMPLMPGINHPMYYIGQLFTRFCWHTEDAFLNSVSYLHQGSAEKVWYAVPPSYAQAFESYASENVFAPSLMDQAITGQALLMNKTTIFDPREVRKRGVEVYRVIHKPGSFVLTAARAYHAGFNCGFNIAEAVNYASPRWFPVGRQASYFAKKIARPLCVPFEYLLFHEAKAIRDENKNKSPVKIPKRWVEYAATVAKELEILLNQGEEHVRQYATKQNCRILMLHEVNKIAQSNQLGPEFGHGAGMICSVCGHACHFYSEMCGSCTDSTDAKCIKHFGEGPKLCSISGHKSIIVRRHDPIMLLDILDTLESIGGVTIDDSVKLARYKGFMRPWETPVRSSGLRLIMNLKLAASRMPPALADKKPVPNKPQEKPRKYRKRTKKELADEESDVEYIRRKKVKKSKSQASNPQRWKHS